jgi:hypothetical protein
LLFATRLPGCRRASGKIVASVSQERKYQVVTGADVTLQPHFLNKLQAIAGVTALPWRGLLEEQFDWQTGQQRDSMEGFPQEP